MALAILWHCALVYILFTRNNNAWKQLWLTTMLRVLWKILLLLILMDIVGINDTAALYPWVSVFVALQWSIVGSTLGGDSSCYKSRTHDFLCVSYTTNSMWSANVLLYASFMDIRCAPPITCIFLPAAKFKYIYFSRFRNQKRLFQRSRRTAHNKNVFWTYSTPINDLISQ